MITKISEVDSNSFFPARKTLQMSSALAEKVVLFSYLLPFPCLQPRGLMTRCDPRQTLQQLHKCLLAALQSTHCPGCISPHCSPATCQVYQIIVKHKSTQFFCCFMNTKQLKYNHSDSDCSSVYTVLAHPSVGIKQLMIKQIKPLLARE